MYVLKTGKSCMLLWLMQSRSFGLNAKSKSALLLITLLDAIKCLVRLLESICYTGTS